MMIEKGRIKPETVVTGVLLACVCACLSCRLLFVADYFELLVPVSSDTELNVSRSFTRAEIDSVLGGFVIRR